MVNIERQYGVFAICKIKMWYVFYIVKRCVCGARIAFNTTIVVCHLLAGCFVVFLMKYSTTPQNLIYTNFLVFRFPATSAKYVRVCTQVNSRNVMSKSFDAI